MRRTHARLLVRRTRDPEWVALSPLASWLYGELLLTPEITPMGTLTLLPRQWAKRNVGTNVIAMTEEIVWSLVAELVESQHILVDYDTDEVMIRTFLRNDGIAANHTALLSVCRAADVVRSPRLRDALAIELERVLRELPPPVGVKRPKLYPAVVGALQEAIKNLTDGNRLPPGPRGAPTGDAMGDPMGDPMGDRMAPPPSLFDPPSDGGSAKPGEGEGEGSSVLHVETFFHTRGPRQDPSQDEPEPEPATPDDQDRAERLTRAYRELEPMSVHERVLPPVTVAVEAGRWTEAEIAAALARLAADRRSVTVETLRIELSGPPPPRAGPARPRTRRSTASPASYLALAAEPYRDRLADPNPSQTPNPEGSP